MQEAHAWQLESPEQQRSPSIAKKKVNKWANKNCERVYNGPQQNKKKKLKKNYGTDTMEYDSTLNK